MFAIVLFLIHSLLELLAGFIVFSGKSTSDGLLSKEDSESLSKLTKTAKFVSIIKRGRYLGGALFTFSLLGFYALLNTSISQHDLESMLIGKVLCLFHFNAFMVDVISSLVTREQGLFLVLASPHFYLFCGFVGFVLKFI
jgi:hypothetical protein